MKVILAKNYSHVKNNFTGIVIKKSEQAFMFYKRGKWHNENGPAFISFGNRYGSFWFNDNVYGNYFNNFNEIKSWKKKVKILKRQERLNIFK